MPALYRMPVFYLALIFGTLAFGLGRGRKAPEAATPAEIVVKPQPVDPGPRIDDGILRTAGGLRRKVLVKDLAVSPRAEPGGGGPAVGKPLDYFAIRYLYEKKAGSFRVGTREGGPQGWVPEGSVLEWDTRLMAKPTPRAGRAALVIYRERDCLADALAGRACLRHPGGCPTEGEEAAASAGIAQEQGGPTLGFPILETRTVEGKTIFEVASLVRDQAPPPTRAAEPPPDLRPALRSVYVAFAIDTTKSMQATIDAARRLAADLARAATDRQGDITLRLALVEYRDADPRYGFKARLATRFTDPRGFLQALGHINAATRGDGSVPEAVFDGIDLALPGEGHVDWPGGRLGQFATKLLVLLGDAPDHAQDLIRAKALAAQAKAAGISIATVAIDRPGSLSRDEASRYQAQWRTLAEDAYRPPDKATDFAAPIAPLAIALGDGGDALVGRLQSLIDDRIDRARTLAALAEAEAEGRLREYVDSRGLTLDRVAPVLVDLHRGDEPRSAPARPDPRHDGRKAPSVRRGWIAEKVDGRPLVAVEMLMTRAELTDLIDELARLQQAATGYARGLADLLPIGTAAATGETSFLAADRGRSTFADHLRRRQELPPARPDALLGRTQTDLQRADPLALAALEARLRASLLTLSRRRDDDDWSDPARTVDGLALVPYAAIDF